MGGCQLECSEEEHKTEQQKVENKDVDIDADELDLEVHMNSRQRTYLAQRAAEMIDFKDQEILSVIELGQSLAGILPRGIRDREIRRAMTKCQRERRSRRS